MSGNATIVTRHATGKKVQSVEAGGKIIDYLEQIFPDGMGYDGEHFSVLVDGKNIQVDLNVGAVGSSTLLTPDLCCNDLAKDDVLTITVRPSGFDPITIAIAIIVAIVAAVAVIALTPKPSAPNSQGEAAKDSPNNSLRGQSNIARPYQAIPEIFGRIVAYPDLAQPSLFEYINNQKIVREVFILGVGQYEEHEVRSGDTLVDQIPGSSYTKHEPNNPPVDLQIGRGSNEISGQELIASNDVSIQRSGSFRFEHIVNVGDDDNYIYFSRTNIVEELSLNITMQFIVIGGTQAGQYTYTDSSIIGEEIRFTVQQTVTTEALFSGALARTDVDLDRWVGYFALNGRGQEAWFHYQMPRGLRTENGDSLNITYQIQVRDVDTLSVVSDTSHSVSGNTIDPQFRTTKILGLDPDADYEVRTRRTSESPGGLASDLIQWEDAVSVRGYSSSTFGNVTVYDLRTRAVLLALSSSRRQFNVDTTRQVGTWTESGGHNTAPASTLKFADAILHTLTAAGRPLSEIDLVSLYGIQDGLSDQRLGEFNYSFDDNDISLGQRIQTMCNTCRVNFYRDGQVWRFFRDEVRPQTMMFNRRNIRIGSGQRQVASFQRPRDFDSVSIRYVSPETNKRAQFNIRINVSDGTFTEGQLGLRPNQIDLAGCRNLFQARDRARLEVRRLIYTRRQVEETLESDGLNIDLGDRVKWVDIYDTETSDGDIRAINGDIYATSERVHFTSSGTYFVEVTDADGAIRGPFAATQVPGNDYAFRASISGVNFLIPDFVTAQSGSKYFLGEASDQSISDMVIATKAPQDGDAEKTSSVRVKMLQYDSRIYEMDGQA